MEKSDVEPIKESDLKETIKESDLKSLENEIQLVFDEELNDLSGVIHLLMESLQKPVKVFDKEIPMKEPINRIVKIENNISDLRNYMKNNNELLTDLLDVLR